MILGEPFESVIPLFSSAAKHSNSQIEAWLFISVPLAIIRACQAFDMESSGAWRITAIVHIAEVFYHTYNGVVTERAFEKQILPPAVILAGVWVNAAWFAAAWITLDSASRTGVTKKQ